MKNVDFCSFLPGHLLSQDDEVPTHVWLAGRPRQVSPESIALRRTAKRRAESTDADDMYPYSPSRPAVSSPCFGRPLGWARRLLRPCVCMCIHVLEYGAESKSLQLQIF